MNTLNRIELAIRRAASQMGHRDAALFRLAADEIAAIAHERNEDTLEVLNDYRNHG